MASTRVVIIKWLCPKRGGLGKAPITKELTHVTSWKRRLRIQQTISEDLSFVKSLFSPFLSFQSDGVPALILPELIQEPPNWPYLLVGILAPSLVS